MKIGRCTCCGSEDVPVEEGTGHRLAFSSEMEYRRDFYCEICRTVPDRTVSRDQLILFAVCTNLILKEILKAMAPTGVS